MTRTAAVLFTLLLCSACSESTDIPDTGLLDGGGGGMDAAGGDAGGTDAGETDAGTADDAGGTDAGDGTDGGGADAAPMADAGTCGSVICGPGQRCCPGCNPGDGICVSTGIGCPLLVCDGGIVPVDAGRVCGTVICVAPQVCCNPLTSTCADPGMVCTL